MTEHHLKESKTLMFWNNFKIHVVVIEILSANKYGWKLSLPVNMHIIKHAVCCN